MFFFVFFFVRRWKRRKAAARRERIKGRVGVVVVSSALPRSAKEVFEVE